MSQLETFTVFLTYAEYGVQEMGSVEAQSAEHAGRYALDTFVAGLEDDEDKRDTFEEADTGFIRAGVRAKVYRGYHDEEPHDVAPEFALGPD